jgi:hypothetical protein
MISEESADWILERASLQGVKFSRRQLAEWHRSGLLPTPRKPGLGRGKGSRAVYPAGTLAQAVACCRLMEKMTRIDDVGWTLWTLGYLVAERFWRGPFEQTHRSLRDVLSVSAEPNEPDDDSPHILSDTIELLIGQVVNLPDVPPQLGLARRRLGPELLKEVLGVAASTAIGSFRRSEHDPDEVAIQVRLIGRFLGVVPATHKKAIPPSDIVQVTGGFVIDNLEAMSPILLDITSTDFLNQFTNAEIETARDELQYLLRLFFEIREREAKSRENKTPDADLLAQFLGKREPCQQATAILIWLAARRIPGWFNNLQILMNSIPIITAP